VDQSEQETHLDEGHGNSSKAQLHHCEDEFCQDNNAMGKEPHLQLLAHSLFFLFFFPFCLKSCEEKKNNKLTNSKSSFLTPETKKTQRSIIFLEKPSDVKVEKLSKDKKRINKNGQ